MFRKLRSTRGSVSRREVLLGILIGLMCVYFASEFLRYLARQQSVGDDALRANTAESVTIIQSNNGMDCPVRGCTGGKNGCIHKAGDKYVGYYDDVLNTIVGEKMYGYNESSRPRIDGKVYRGEPGTLVIKVTVGGGEVELDWETGKK